MRLTINCDIQTEREGDETAEDEDRLADLATRYVRDSMGGLVEEARAQGLDVKITSSSD